MKTKLILLLLLINGCATAPIVARLDSRKVVKKSALISRAHSDILVNTNGIKLYVKQTPPFPPYPVALAAVLTAGPHCYEKQYLPPDSFINSYVFQTTWDNLQNEHTYSIDTTYNLDTNQWKSIFTLKWTDTNSGSSLGVDLQVGPPFNYLSSTNGQVRLSDITK